MAGVQGAGLGCRRTGAAPESRGLEQRVAREAIRAVHPRARALTRREEPVDGSTAIEVGRDATHRVMRSGGDGDRLPQRVDPDALAVAHEIRKAVAQPVSAEM